MSRGLAGALLLALVLRAAAIAACDREAADVARYAKVARHLLDVSWNPYQTQRLYPYPPPWAAVEAAAGWVGRKGLAPFAIAVKLPILLADLLIVLVLALIARRGRASPLAPWLYAAHPVAILVGAVHGQFDAIALLLVLVALEATARGRRDLSAFALAGAIATKSFPVLLLPLLAFADGASWRRAVRFGLLATVPVALLLAPFALADAAALRRELFSYSGIADFGWTGVWRALEWLTTGSLPRSEARFWPAAAAASKLIFLAAWGALLVALRRERLRLDPALASLAVVLAFLALYGLQSAQYLLWAVPLGLLRPGRWSALYAAAAAAGLAGFYLFLAPGVLAPAALEAESARRAGGLWLAGALATLLVSLAWLAALVGHGRRAALQAQTTAALRTEGT